MSEPLLAGFPVVVRQAVVWGEMDSYRHVNNVAYRLIGAEQKS
jgi:acyl-CoA thioesterase FadM